MNDNEKDANYWRDKYKPKLHTQQYYKSKYVYGIDSNPKKKPEKTDFGIVWTNKADLFFWH